MRQPPYFGLSLNLPTTRSEQLIERAVAADQWGYDLFSLMDHPYAADLHEAYATLAFVLGRTQRIIGYVGVTNLPLHPTPVLARFYRVSAIEPAATPTPRIWTGATRPRGTADHRTARRRLDPPVRLGLALRPVPPVASDRRRGCSSSRTCPRGHHRLLQLRRHAHTERPVTHPRR